MVLAATKGQEELAFSMLWLVSYVFLLRVPSEVRPRCARPRTCLLACVSDCLMPGFADEEVRSQLCAG